MKKGLSLALASLLAAGCTKSEKPHRAHKEISQTSSRVEEVLSFSSAPLNGYASETKRKENDRYRTELSAVFPSECFSRAIKAVLVKEEGVFEFIMSGEIKLSSRQNPSREQVTAAMMNQLIFTDTDSDGILEEDERVVSAGWNREPKPIEITPAIRAQAQTFYTALRERE